MKRPTIRVVVRDKDVVRQVFRSGSQEVERVAALPGITDGRDASSTRLSASPDGGGV